MLAKIILARDELGFMAYAAALQRMRMAERLVQFKRVLIIEFESRILVLLVQDAIFHD
jgi:hypothetical protein